MARHNRSRKKVRKVSETTDNTGDTESPDGLISSCRPAYETLRRAIYNSLVLVMGAPSVGKKTIVKRLFEDNKNILHAYVDCHSVILPTKFFSSICEQFQDGLNISRKTAVSLKLPESGKPVSRYDFSRYFEEYSKIAEENDIKRLYVVLNHAEVFDRTNMISCLTSMTSVKNLYIIIITYESSSDFIEYAHRVSKTAGSRIQDSITPVIVPTWSHSDIVEFICRYPPDGIDKELYKPFVKTIVKIYQSESKNPTQILYCCQDYFNDFYRQHHTYLKASSVRDVMSLAKSFKIEKQTFIRRGWTASNAELKMPSNTAFLMIAAYIAAYTRPTDDAKTFVKKQKVRKQRESVPDCNSKSFTLERLYHLFRAVQRTALGNISNNIVYNNVTSMLSDVERLENLNILMHQSGWSSHPEARYKLSPCVKRDYVTRLAKNNDIELHNLGTIFEQLVD